MSVYEIAGIARVDQPVSDSWKLEKVMPAFNLFGENRPGALGVSLTGAMTASENEEDDVSEGAETLYLFEETAGNAATACAIAGTEHRTTRQDMTVRHEKLKQKIPEKLCTEHFIFPGMLPRGISAE